MALGGTNSMGSSTKNSITITNTMDITFLNDFFPISLGDISRVIPGNYDMIKILAGSSQSLNFASYQGTNTISGYYYDEIRYFNKLHEDGAGSITFEHYYASNPVLARPLLVSFVDNEGNKKWGWRVVKFTNSSSSDWSTTYNVPAYYNLYVSIYKYAINNTDATVSSKYEIHNHFKVLTYDTVSETYVVTPYDYDFVSTNNSNYSSKYGYEQYGQLTIPYTHILCGISDINAQYIVYGLEPQEE